MPKSNKILRSFRTVWETAEFLHDLLERVDEKKTKPGDNIAPLAKQLKLSVPHALAGARITYQKRSSSRRNRDYMTLVKFFDRKGPGTPQATWKRCACLWGFCVCIACESAGPSGGWKCVVTIERSF